MNHPPVLAPARGKVQRSAPAATVAAFPAGGRHKVGSTAAPNPRVAGEASSKFFAHVLYDSLFVWSPYQCQGAKRAHHRFADFDLEKRPIIIVSQSRAGQPSSYNPWAPPPAPSSLLLTFSLLPPGHPVRPRGPRSTGPRATLTSKHRYEGHRAAATSVFSSLSPATATPTGLPLPLLLPLPLPLPLPLLRLRPVRLRVLAPRRPSCWHRIQHCTVNHPSSIHPSRCLSYETPDNFPPVHPGHFSSRSPGPLTSTYAYYYYASSAQARTQVRTNRPRSAGISARSFVDCPALLKHHPLPGQPTAATRLSHTHAFFFLAWPRAACPSGSGARNTLESHTPPTAPLVGLPPAIRRARCSGTRISRAFAHPSTRQSHSSLCSTRRRTRLRPLQLDLQRCLTYARTHARTLAHTHRGRLAHPIHAASLDTARCQPRRGARSEVLTQPQRASPAPLVVGLGDEIIATSRSRNESSTHRSRLARYTLLGAVTNHGTHDAPSQDSIRYAVPPPALPVPSPPSRRDAFALLSVGA
ncbi:hypothetical protein Purlil1_7266 [Purpureocillium lilacinum]|uniref:Uncharacterized protein n=1 Tax=Purpureocillium lilacinum TaxID=33203 RepID=A0ABR0BWM2_PURLI|nr:hypothetical protein Purlil1_7266 [Purpureocillium lilacinum]